MEAREIAEYLLHGERKELLTNNSSMKLSFEYESAIKHFWNKTKEKSLPVASSKRIAVSL